VTCKADIYSLGITMWQMQSREQPYLGEDIHSVIYKVPKLEITFKDGHNQY
jgi:proto-oncogene serine/threonine-protein kinase mos